MVRALIRCACWTVFALSASGCAVLPPYFRNGFKVGPNFETPPATVAESWIDADDKRIHPNAEVPDTWWTAFQDPVLDQLIADASRQNLTLREAGFRILQARAELALTVGGLFPQAQFAQGSYQRSKTSSATASSQFLRTKYFSQWNQGFTLAWELDFWGRFRRAVESSSAVLDASVHDYDDVLVTLLGDVASNYAQVRVAQQRIRYARINASLQRDTVGIVENREKVGLAKQLDVDQAKSVLFQTEAAIPELEIGLRQATNRLCTLLGKAPEDLRARLGIPNTPEEATAGMLANLVHREIPSADANILVGIPADLLRRRPDVRRAERLVAAQSAQIGIAKAEYLPHILINGTLGGSAADFTTLFKAPAFTGNVGPAFTWNIFNYGRIHSNVRLQRSRFQGLITRYQGTVLTAQQEVENGLVTFLKSQQRAKLQGQSVDHAQRSASIVLAQYEAGTVSISQLILILQNLVLQQDTLARAKGDIALGLIQTYRALGGGWEIGEAQRPPPRPHFGRPF
ncbi:MAG: efflux transporter outer membrane subunit [Planctomycetes bacterium]|nr:efflux transporter outer membrane subunit [Planctomycetota bacterium]